MSTSETVFHFLFLFVITIFTTLHFRNHSHDAKIPGLSDVFTFTSDGFNIVWFFMDVVNVRLF